VLDRGRRRDVEAARSLGYVEVRAGGSVTSIPMAVPLTVAMLWWYAFVTLLALEESSVFVVPQPVHRAELVGGKPMCMHFDG
jgi:hypothetical protein